MVAALLLWWKLVPATFSGIKRLNPALHTGNLVAIALTSMILGGIGLILWMEIRKRSRQRAMRGISGGP
jgi:cell division septal protein FtsQ